MHECGDVYFSFSCQIFFFFFRFLTSFLSLHTLECLRITWGAILKCKFPGPTFSRTEVGTEDFLTSTSENSNANGQCILKTLSYSLLILKPGAIWLLPSSFQPALALMTNHSPECDVLNLCFHSQRILSIPWGHLHALLFQEFSILQGPE